MSKKNPTQRFNLEYFMVRISQIWRFFFLAVLLLLEITGEKPERPEVPQTSKNAQFEMCDMNN